MEESTFVGGFRGAGAFETTIGCIFGQTRSRCPVSCERVHLPWEDGALMAQNGLRPSKAVAASPPPPNYEVKVRAVHLEASMSTSDGSKS